MKHTHPYNDKDNFDTVAEVYCGGYSWAIACVFRHKFTGRLYGDSDSGCSCYGPFEEGGWGGNHSFEDCVEITDIQDAGKLLNGVYGEDGGVSTTEYLDFVHKVADALRD